jgi:hypothetical protein
MARRSSEEEDSRWELELEEDSELELEDDSDEVPNENPVEEDSSAWGELAA